MTAPLLSGGFLLRLREIQVALRDARALQEAV